MHTLQQILDLIIEGYRRLPVSNEVFPSAALEQFILLSIRSEVYAGKASSLDLRTKSEREPVKLRLCVAKDYVSLFIDRCSGFQHGDTGRRTTVLKVPCWASQEEGRSFV